MRKYYQTKCYDHYGKEICEGDELEVQGIVRIWKATVDFKEGEFIAVYEDGTWDPLRDIAKYCIVSKTGNYYKE